MIAIVGMKIWSTIEIQGLLISTLQYVTMGIIYMFVYTNHIECGWLSIWLELHQQLRPYNTWLVNAQQVKFFSSTVSKMYEFVLRYGWNPILTEVQQIYSSWYRWNETFLVPFHANSLSLKAAIAFLWAWTSHWQVIYYLDFQELTLSLKSHNNMIIESHAWENWIWTRCYELGAFIDTLENWKY